MNKKRAVSPILATILLIGLTVTAGSMLFLVVIPMLEPRSDIEILDIYYYYNEGLTAPKKNPKAQADAYVVEFMVRNTGTKVISIDSASILDRNGNDMNATLHTPKHLEEELQTVSDFSFMLSFVKKHNPPTVVQVQIVADGKTCYSEFITLE